MTARVVLELKAILACAARQGAWFYDRDYQMLVHLTPTPLGRAPGAGIPAGRREPEHALDCLFIAEADSAEHAHVFAVDGARHAAQVRAGVFEPPGGCPVSGCPNLALPRREACLGHLEPAWAAWPTG